MPTFRRRGKKWRVEMCYQGKRLSASFATKLECERWATLKMYELTHNEQHPTAPPRNVVPHEKPNSSST